MSGEDFKVDPASLEAVAAKLRGHADDVEAHGRTLAARTAGRVGHGPIGATVETLVRHALDEVSNVMTQAVSNFHRSTGDGLEAMASRTRQADAEAAERFPANSHQAHIDISHSAYRGRVHDHLGDQDKLDLPTPKPTHPLLANTSGLEARYKGEEIPHNRNNWLPDEVRDRGGYVKYLSDAERAPYEVVARDGKLHSSDGQLLDTSQAHNFRGVVGKAIYVVDPAGKIYVSMEQDLFRFHHSSLGQGQPVAGAGEIVVDAGTIKMINRASGHYRPTTAQLDQTVTFLKSLGLDLDNAEVRFGVA